MIITPGNASSVLGGLFTTYQTRWQKVYKATEIWWPKVASLEPSSTAQNIYAWMDRVPKLRKWIGDRQFNTLISYSQTVPNADYEDTLVMDANSIEDDQFGVFNSRSDFLAMACKKWPDQIVRDQMIAAQTTVGYDGVDFFSNAHPVNKFNLNITAPGGGTTQSNYDAATPLTPANYAAKRAAMMAWVGADGEVFGFVPDTLAVPPSLEPMARMILHSDIIATQTFPASSTNVGGYSNTLKGTADLVVIPELANETVPAWYLLCTKAPVKPFIFQQRKTPDLVPLVSPTDPNVFLNRQYIMGCHARGAATTSLWWLAYKAATA